MRAIPTDNFRFCPPDSVLDNLCLFASRSRTPTISLTSFWTVSDGHPFNYNVQSIMVRILISHLNFQYTKNVPDLQLNKVHFIYPFYHTNMVHSAFRDVILMKYSQKLYRLNNYIHNNNLNKKISGGS